MFFHRPIRRAYSHVRVHTSCIQTVKTWGRGAVCGPFDLQYVCVCTRMNSPARPRPTHKHITNIRPTLFNKQL